MKWKNKNAGKHPAEPDYIDGYDAEEDYDRYLAEVEMKEEARKGN